MPGGNTIRVQVLIDTGAAESSVKRTNQAIESMGGSAQKASTQGSNAFKGFQVAIEQTTSSIFSLGQALAGLAVVQMARQMFQAADSLSKVQIALTALTGSADIAKQQMADLASLAQRSPFALKDLADGARRMQAFGFAAKDVVKDMEAISKTVATVGGGEEQIAQIVQALGIMREKGVAQAQQLFKQIAARGVDVMQVIKDMVKAATGEILSDQDVRDLMEKGRLSGKLVAEGLIKAMQDTTKNAAPDMMKLTTVGFQKVEDEAQKLAKVIADDLAPKMLEVIEHLKEWIKLLEGDKGLRDSLIGVAEALGAVGAGYVISKPFWAILGGLADAAPAIGTVLGTIAEGLGGIGASLAIIGASAGVYVLNKLLGPGVSEETQAGKPVQQLYDRLNQRLPSPASHAVTTTAPPPVGQGTMADLFAYTAKIDESRKKPPSPIMRDVELFRAQLEESQAILARAREQDYEGLAGLEVKYQQQRLKDLAELKKAHQGSRLDQETEDNLAAAHTLDVQRLLRQWADKDREERQKADLAAIDNRIAALRVAGQEEIALADAVVKDTPEKEAIAAAHRIDITRATSEKIRDEEYKRAALVRKNASDELDARTNRETTTVNRLSQAYLDAMIHKDAQQKVIDDTYRESTAKADIDATKATNDAIAEMTKKSAEETTNYLKQMRQTEDNAQIASAERQIDIQRTLIDGQIAQTAQQHLDLIKKTTEFEIAAAYRVNEVRKKVARDDLNEIIAGHEKTIEYLKAHGRFAEVQNEEDAIKAARDAARSAEYAADAELVDKETKMRLDAIKQVNETWLEANREVFDKLESGVGQVFDALFERGKNFWKSMGDMALKAGKDILKAIVVPSATAAIMTAGGMPVQMQQNLDYGSGWLGQLMNLTTRKPVFPNKIQLDGDIGKLKLTGRGNVPVEEQGRPQTKAEVTTRNESTLRVSASGSSGQLLSRLMDRFRFTPSGGGGGGGGDTPSNFSRVLSYTFQTGETFAGQPGGGASPWSFAQAALGGSGGSPWSFAQAGLATASGGGGSWGTNVFNTSDAYGGLGGAANAASLAGMPLGGGGMSINNLVTMGASKGLFSGLRSLFGGTNLGMGTTWNMNTGAMGTAPIQAPFAHSALASAMGPAAVMGGIMAMRGAYSLGQIMQNKGVPGAPRGLMSGALGAFGGLLAAGGLAAMFPSVFVPLLAAGPVGWIAAAAIGATIGLIGAFKETDTAHARNLVKQMYGIDIKNQQVLAQIVNIAKQKYGGAISLAVASPEVQQLVNLYAATQGLGAVGPRPMYGATFTQGIAGSSGLQLQPTYSNGIVVANPYTGTTTQQMLLASQNVAGGASQSLFVQLDPQAASQLFAGQVVNVINRNPTVVGNANSTAISSGSSRSDQLGGLLEPFTVHA